MDRPFLKVVPDTTSHMQLLSVLYCSFILPETNSNTRRHMISSVLPNCTVSDTLIHIDANCSPLAYILCRTNLFRLLVRGGCRVIALAYKQLDSSVNASDLRTMPRGTVEQGLCFGGFAVLRCPLKPESEPALKMLKDSSHQLVMITGDAPLTACYTAGQVHIVDRPVLLLVHRQATDHCMCVQQALQHMLFY